MTFLVLLLGCADTAGDTAAPGFDYAGYEFVPFDGLTAPPDVASERLCAENADPEAAADTTFIDCALEGGQFADPDAAPKDELVVLTWNLERGVHLDSQLQGITSGLVPEADLLLISEADRGCDRSGARNVPWDFAEAMGLDYVFAVEFVELPNAAEGGPGVCEHGNFIASRYPMGNVRAFRHAENRSWYIPPDERPGDQPRLGGRIAIAADVAVGDRYLHLYVVHYESSLDAHAIQVAQAEETAIDAAGRPFLSIVGGDTNAFFYTTDVHNGDSNDPTIGAFLDRGFTDAHDELPFEERHTLGPLIIDVILGSQDRFSDPGVCPEADCGGWSDHLPVWATVEIP